MERLSLDSSVVVKWFTVEEYTDKALEIRDAFVDGKLELIVTPLLFCEVANALRYKPDYNRRDLNTAIEVLYNLQMKVEEIDVMLLKRSAEIALSTGVTVYDAIPVAVAERYKTVCITADEKTQYSRMKDGYPILLLKDYHTG